MKHHRNHDTSLLNVARSIMLVSIALATWYLNVLAADADELFGGWKNAIETHFVDGGTFDQMYQLTTQQPR